MVGSRWRGGIRGGVSPVSIVWPCPLPAGVYAAAGREGEFPRPDCPSCAVPMVFWSGYRRYVRDSGICVRIFVPRVRCGPCEVSHALLPAFVLARRLDVAEVIGKVVGEVAGGGCGVRPAAERAGVPYTTARGWVRRFGVRARGLGVAFAALAVELGGDAIRPPADAGRFAVAASGRGPADGRGAGRGGAADRRAGSPAPGRVPAPLLAGDDRPVAPGLARRRPGGPAARGTLGYRDGP